MRSTHGKHAQLALVCWLRGGHDRRMTSHLTRHHAPDGVLEAPGYSNLVVAEGRLVVVAGQVARDADGALVGPGDFLAQAHRVFENIRRCLAAVDATFLDVVKLTYFLTDITNLPLLREARAAAIPDEHRPASTAVEVSALFEPGFLLEVEALAVVPAGR